MATKRQYASLSRKIEKLRDKIGKDRDLLRDLVDEAEAILNSVEDATLALETAIEVLSEYA